ncbi:MAG: glycoside hydrolase family 25 protein [Phocaeicola sp.]
MNKKTPVAASRKPRAPKGITTTRGVTPKRTSAAQPRKRSTRKGRSAKRKSLFILTPQLKVWAKYAGMVLFSLLFLALFYYFFIRPYSYRWKPCYGLAGYGVCLPHGYEVHGIDISHHQGTINWQQLSLAKQGPFPIHFIFLKASEGGDFSDRIFEASFDSARVHGFIRGAYHFYNPKTDPLAQAEFFIRTVKLEPGDLPPVLDIEVRADNQERLRRDLKIWLDRVEGHYGVKPILYTGYKYKMRHLNDSLFNSYPYWIAHYYVDSVRYQGEWDFWQHTDVGDLPGIIEKVDLNVFNGSLDALKQLTLKRVRN